MPAPVLAASPFGDEETETSPPLLRDELSLYGAPQRAAPRTEPEAGQLEQRVAALRQLAGPYTGWCRGVYDGIKPKVQGAVAAVKNPPEDFYARAGVIGFTGVLGAFLARGSRVKKLVYPVSLMTVSASLYYPERAAAVAKSTGDSVYDRAVQSYAALERMAKPPGKGGKVPDPDDKP